MKTRLIILCIMVYLAGCSTEQKATRKILKLHTMQPNVLAKICGSLYPPLAYVKDSIAYKPGRQSEIIYVYANCDSIPDNSKKNQDRIIKIPCPQTIVTDTLFVFKEKQVVNRAEVTELRQLLDNSRSYASATGKENNILRVVSLLLGLYTLLRWLLRIWNIKLP